jgi:hypothetical protein
MNQLTHFYGNTYQGYAAGCPSSGVLIRVVCGQYCKAVIDLLVSVIRAVGSALCSVNVIVLRPSFLHI